MSVFNKLFRWRSRVKTGAPDIQGDIETLSSHVNDENAHPSYLKKGQAVPTGQEQATLAKHRADPLSHVANLVRRPELLRTLAQYNAAKNSDLVNTINNYTKTSDQVTPHVVTAYVLAQVLASWQDETKLPTNVGDGTYLVYTDDNAVLRQSTSTVGSATEPVYLKNGKITKTDAMVNVAGNQTITGTKTFNTLPKTNATTPTLDNELVPKSYVDSKTGGLPVGFCVTTVSSINTASQVRDLIGYGNWALLIEVANVGYMWQRVS